MGNSALRSHVGLKLAARPKRQREKERNWKNRPRIFLSSKSQNSLKVEIQSLTQRQGSVS